MVVKTVAKGILPSYKTGGAAGADVCAYMEHPVCLKPGERACIPTGLFMQIPEGYEIQVRPRSGLAANKGITVLNTPGTIDSDYRGEIQVILINLSQEDYVVNDGDRIAQLVFAPVVKAYFSRVDAIDNTERGAGGFGSTGV